MDAVLLELVEVARRAGLVIGTSEVLDAQRALSAIGIENREVVRYALAATLVKRSEDRVMFDRVFDRFFRADAGARRSALDRLAAEGTERATLDRLAGLAFAAGAASGGGTGMATLLADDAERDLRVEAAMRSARVSEITSPMQVGRFALRTLAALGMDAPLEEAIAALRDDAPELADALQDQLESMRREVRALVREQLERLNPDRLARGRAARLSREAFAALTLDEVGQVTEEVRRLGALLRDRLDRRRRRSRVGQLDVRRTIRASFRSAAVPFAPAFKKRRRERPKLVVLADISDSVRAAARFLLVLVYAMQEAFSRTRSFVFVRDVAETTALFRERSAEEAVATAFRGDVLNVGANSDYGRVLGQFVEHHLDALDRHTTVIILGDGRSNQLDPNVAALRDIARRAGRVLWFNPEPESAWGFGDSEMDRYRPHVAHAASVRSLSELREAMETLARAIRT